MICCSRCGKLVPMKAVIWLGRILPICLRCNEDNVYVRPADVRPAYNPRSADDASPNDGFWTPDRKSRINWLDSKMEGGDITHV